MRKKKYGYKLNTDNRGLSLVELVIVIAIMAVLLGVLGFSLSMLFSTEARQASNKMNAQLNDVKTGAMSRASEYLVLRYIDVDSTNKATQAAMAELGVDKSGYYCEKHISTITNGDSGSPAPSDVSVPGSVKVDYGGVEYTRIGSKRVDISVNGNQISNAGTDGVYIEYDRKTGRLEDVQYVTIGGTIAAPSFAVTSGEQLNDMTFKSGLREYKITFDAETGKHTLGK